MSRAKLDMAYATIRKMESQLHLMNVAVEILKDSRLYHGANIDARIDAFLALVDDHSGNQPRPPQAP